ncbi:type VI secretion lipofamily protein [Ralstonia insidiosa]|uniref:Type VI secretion lipofamily protein n=1 Tax=Ralstonia insidiosa TaxID=190721 RepID=A0AAC9FTA9_9RALS|nr:MULTISPECIES: type VI secretion system lipoprotein TssJ [Ralstonia]ANH75579.1 type VI secretion lipofamily protein [Ralstonia insidiosa]EPX98864.1 hypothetical protein C404_06655 [Ralstonia sp. AU12-08]
MSIRLVIAAITTAMLLSACGAWQAASDASSEAWRSMFSNNLKVLDVDLRAREALNPDGRGRATPVAVRIYQLTDRKAFDDASFADLLNNDSTVLAHDLLASMAAVLNPGASVSLSQPMQADTAVVAVVALYREPGGSANWRRVFDRKELGGTPLKLTLGDQAIARLDGASRAGRRSE